MFKKTKHNKKNNKKIQQNTYLAKITTSDLPSLCFTCPRSRVSTFLKDYFNYLLCEFPITLSATQNKNVLYLRHQRPEKIHNCIDFHCLRSQHQPFFSGKNMCKTHQSLIKMISLKYISNYNSITFAYVLM